MAVMLLRTFPVTHARARPIVGRRFFETARHDNRIKFARARNRHERGAGSRPANACGSPGGIPQYHLDVAGSVALIGFGADSIIEVASSCVLLWWLAEGSIDRDRAAHRLVGACFFALAAYIAIDASVDLLRHEAPRVTYFGILYAGACVVVMPLLARAKRRVAVRLNSNALHADSHQSDICAYLSVILLLGLALNAVLGWWWADPIAALCMLPIIIREGIAGLRGKICSHAHF